MLARRLIFKLFFVCALGTVIAFLALRRSPYLQYVSWMPREIGVWADSHGVVRNTAAFFGFGMAVLVLFGAQAWLVLALCCFGTTVEVAQIWIPGRVFDWKDIGASIAGVVLAWPLAWWFHRRHAVR
jgi:hypothetical protein